MAAQIRDSGSGSFLIYGAVGVSGCIVDLGFEEIRQTPKPIAGLARVPKGRRQAVMELTPE